MVNIDFLKEKYFENYLPCPYKLKFGNEILIYPITVKDYPEFESSVEILKIDKNGINDAEIISMSQIEFLCKYIFSINKKIDGFEITEGENNIQKFKYIFEKCLNESYVTICQDSNDKYLIAVYELVDEDKKEFSLKYCITNKEFLEISKIILFQNFEDYGDEYVNPEILELYKEYIEIKYKNVASPSFEKRKIYVLGKYGCDFEYLNNMPYRLFDLLYQSYIDNDRYYIENMYKTAYKYDIKEEIEHPLFKKKKDKFEELFMSEQSLNNKLGNNN